MLSQSPGSLLPTTPQPCRAAVAERRYKGVRLDGTERVRNDVCSEHLKEIEALWEIFKPLKKEIDF